MRKTHTISDRPLTARHVSAVLVFTGAAALASAAGQVRAEEIDAACLLYTSPSPRDS